MKEPNGSTHRRVVVYIPKDDYNELRAKLIMLGETVSSWFRKIIKDFLQK